MPEPKHECESCDYYWWIDSAYGHCVRYPPKLMKIVKWFSFQYDWVYPTVAFNNVACGERKPRTRR